MPQLIEALGADKLARLLIDTGLVGTRIHIEPSVIYSPSERTASGYSVLVSVEAEYYTNQRNVDYFKFRITFNTTTREVQMAHAA